MPVATASPPSTVSPASPAGGGSPSAPASSEHEPSPESYLGDLGPELEALDRGEPLKPPTDKPKSEPKTEPKTEAKTAPEKVEEPPTDDGKPKPEEKKKGPFAVVRDQKVALEKKRDHEWLPKIQSLEAKVLKYEEQLKNGSDVKPFQEKLEAIQKENQALRDEIRFANYQKHPEYVEKFQKPLNEAWTELFGDLNGFKLELEDGQSRDITVADINQLAGLPLKQRGEQARAWFGESAATILQHIRNIAELSKKNEQALDEAKKASATHEEQTKTQYQQQNAAFHQAFTGAGKELIDKYPKWFGESDDDPKGNELLKKGFEFADSVFNNGNLNPQQKAQRLAVIRAKAANHDRLAARLKERDSRIAELEEELAKFEESEPPTDTSGQPGTLREAGFGEDGIGDVRDELLKMERR